MQTKEQILKIGMYSSEVLVLIDNQDDFTRSDLQGCVDALVEKMLVDTL